MSHSDHSYQRLPNCIGMVLCLSRCLHNSHRRSCVPTNGLHMTNDGSQLCWQQQKCDEYYYRLMRCLPWSAEVLVSRGLLLHVDRANGGELCHDHHAHVAAVNSSWSRQITISRRLLSMRLSLSKWIHNIWAEDSPYSTYLGMSCRCRWCGYVLQKFYYCRSWWQYWDDPKDYFGSARV